MEESVAAPSAETAWPSKCRRIVIVIVMASQSTEAKQYFTVSMQDLGSLQEGKYNYNCGRNKQIGAAVMCCAATLMR